MSSFKRKVKTSPSSSGANEGGTSEVIATADSESVLDAVNGLAINNNVSDSNRSSSNNKSSSFQTVVPITGWKPWVHTGLGVISSGHRQLDDLLGGGVPLGTTSLYLTENYSAFGQTLFAYNIAEGVSHGHENLIIVDNGHEAEKMLRLLPLNLNVEKIDPSLSSSAATTTTPDEITDKDSATKSSESGFGLKIAWQYEKYLSK